MSAEFSDWGPEQERLHPRDEHGEWAHLIGAPGVFWHGTPSGDLRGGAYGLHVGSHEAAHQALTARIGHPAEGTWDGTREYGKTLLAGNRTLRERGISSTGYNIGQEDDHYPSGRATYGDGTPVPMDARPTMIPVRIKGPMTNAPQSPHDDFKANGLMHGQIKRGRARSGYFYTNVGEDDGSISAVVPNGDHLERLDTPAPEPAQQASDWGREANDPRDYAGVHQPNIDGPSLDDLTGPGRDGEPIAPGDLYTHPEYYNYGTPGDESAKTYAESIKAIKAARGKPDAMVTIYRAAPPGVTSINQGDWITLSPTYAEIHARQGENEKDDWPVYSVKVPARTVRWDANDLNEFGYDGPPTPPERSGRIRNGVYVDPPGVQASARLDPLDRLDSSGGGGAVAGGASDNPTSATAAGGGGGTITVGGGSGFAAGGTFTPPVVAAGTCSGPGPCDTHPLGHGKNWVNKVGGLPHYIRAIAHAMMRSGRSESHAVAAAIAAVKRWAAGGGGVSAGTRERAAKAVAEWEAKKAAAAGDTDAFAVLDGFELDAAAQITPREWMEIDRLAAQVDAEFDDDADDDGEFAWNESLHPRAKGKFAPKGSGKESGSGSSGVPDPDTASEAEIRQFQKDHLLPETGKMDKGTHDTMKAAARDQAYDAWKAKQTSKKKSTGGTAHGGAPSRFIPKHPRGVYAVEPDEGRQPRFLTVADALNAVPVRSLVASNLGTPNGPTHAGVAVKAADTGRVLMLQRALEAPDDPAAGKWEFPGGAHEDGDQTSLHTGIREWQEETGQPFPGNSLVADSWTAPNGIYQGHIVVVPDESVISPTEGRIHLNPDDPDGDNSEAVAWWDPDDAAANPALREECKSTPWDLIKAAGSDMPDQADMPMNGDAIAEILDAARKNNPTNDGASNDEGSALAADDESALAADGQHRFRHGWIPVGGESDAAKEASRLVGMAHATEDPHRIAILHRQAMGSAAGKVMMKHESGGTKAASEVIADQIRKHGGGHFTFDGNGALVAASAAGDSAWETWSVSGKALALVAQGDLATSPALLAFSADTLEDAGDEFAITADERRQAAESGAALDDGSYPIRSAREVTKAVHAFPRGAGVNGKTKAGIKRHIVKRAHDLKAESALPDTWTAQTASAGLADEELSDEAIAALVAAAVTETPPVEVPDEIGGGVKFRIPLLLPTGVETGDRRKFKKGSLTSRDFPLPLFFQKETDEGHKKSVIVARINKAEKVKHGMGNAIGEFDTGEDAQEALRLIRGLFLRGVSADVDKIDAEMSNADDGKPNVTFSKGRLTAATLVGKPAFAECQIELPGDPEWEQSMAQFKEEYGSGEATQPLVAAGGPMFPPKDWFQDPGLTEPTHLTVSDDGRVFGHIAAWDTDHIGMPFQRAPRSKSGYRYFATGQVKTAEGELVNVGQLTLAGGHADLALGADLAVKHYDDTDSAVADVAIGEDSHGIWVAGAQRPDLTEAQVRQFRASDSSGDWRPIKGNLELVACLQVNCAGFPMPRARVASGAGEPVITALVAAGARSLSRAVRHEHDTYESLSVRLGRIEAAARAEHASELRAVVAAGRAIAAEGLRERVAALEVGGADPKAPAGRGDAQRGAQDLTTSHAPGSLGAMTAAAPGHIYHYKHGWIPLDHEAVKSHSYKANRAIVAARHDARTSPTVRKNLNERDRAVGALDDAEAARKAGNMDEMAQHLHRAAGHLDKGGSKHGDKISSLVNETHKTFPPNNSSPTGDAVSHNPVEGNPSTRPLRMYGADVSPGKKVDYSWDGEIHTGTVQSIRSHSVVVKSDQTGDTHEIKGTRNRSILGPAGSSNARGLMPEATPTNPVDGKPNHPVADRPKISEEIGSGHKLTASKGSSLVRLTKDGKLVNAYRRDLLTDDEIRKQAARDAGSTDTARNLLADKSAKPESVRHPKGADVMFRQPGGTHRAGKVTGVDGSYRHIETRPISGVGKPEKHRIHINQIRSPETTPSPGTHGGPETHRAGQPSDPGKLTRMLPAHSSNRQRILNAQKRVREIHAKPLTQRTSLDMERYKNAKRIIDKFNETGNPNA